MHRRFPPPPYAAYPAPATPPASWVRTASPSPPAPRLPSGFARPHGLLAAAKGEAYGALWAALLAIPFGIVVTVLGGFFVLGLIVGPLFLLLGLVLTPIAIVGIADPTRHEDILRLGRTPAERAYALGQIEALLLGPQAWNVPLSHGHGGPVLLSGGDWLALRGPNMLRLFSKQDALWVYGLERRRRKFGFVYSTTYSLCVRTRSRSSCLELPMTRHQAAWLMPHLHAMMPQAIFGYTPALERASTAHLAAEVDRRNYARHVRHASGYPLAA